MAVNNSCCAYTLPKPCGPVLHAPASTALCHIPQPLCPFMFPRTLPICLSLLVPSLSAAVLCRNAPLPPSCAPSLTLLSPAPLPPPSSPPTPLQSISQEPSSQQELRMPLHCVCDCNEIAVSFAREACVCWASEVAGKGKAKQECQGNHTKSSHFGQVRNRCPAKIGEHIRRQNHRFSPKITENHRFAPKITENHRFSPKITENHSFSPRIKTVFRRKSAKIGAHFRTPEVAVCRQSCCALGACGGP